jgi:hypothetical protein
MGLGKPKRVSLPDLQLRIEHMEEQGLSDIGNTSSIGKKGSAA